MFVNSDVSYTHINRYRSQDIEGKAPISADSYYAFLSYYSQPAVTCIYSYFEKGCRKKNVYATIPKGNMAYDQYTVPDDCGCRTYFCCFPLALANTFPWPFVPIGHFHDDDI